LVELPQEILVTGPDVAPEDCERLSAMAVGEEIQLDDATFRGSVHRPGEPEYDVHRRIWNGSFDKHPAVIVRCAGVSDVIAAVKFGRESGLPVAVRSGGHSFPGLSVADDALMIDLQPMKGVRVDPEKRTARVQAGVLLGELDRETQAFGLAVPSGIVTHTGVAGLTLGGGIGWIQRKFGLSVDQLRSVDLVTADGEFVKASRDENEDLFWGVRGGGGNFGIVTEFEFDCVPLGPQILAGPIFWPMEKSGEVLRFYREWVADAPDDLMTIVVHRMAPPLPFVPEELHGKPVVMVIVCWVGDIEEGEKFVKPLREFSSPVADVCVPKPFLAHQAMLDPSFVPGRWYYFKSCDLAELNDDIIDITQERSLRIKSPLTSFPIWQMGGAISKVDDDETPFGSRKAAFTYNIGCSTETAEGFDEERQWVRDFWSALEPWHQTVYVNFLEDAGEDRIRTAYGAEKYDRLRELKRKYDPDNFFRINQNIPPA
jgi:FAD/FMN-containing dehydrogenase